MKTKGFSTLFILSFLISSCGKEDKKLEEIKSEKLTIDSFNDLPEEIDGCSCLFSSDSAAFNKDKYIYANDFTTTSFMKINGKLVKLTEIEHKDIDSTTVLSTSTGDGFKVEIKAKDKKQIDYELSSKTGTITITDKSGQKITKHFYGECGC